MPLDNPEQNGTQGEPTDLNWDSAPDQFRAAHKRTQDKMAEVQAQLDKVTRENTARAAGIDVSSPLGQMFAENYKGDVTPDAMRTAFEALGVPTSTPETPPAGETTNQPSPEELEIERLRGALHGAATPPGEEPTGDLWLGSGGVFPTFHDAIKSGMRRDDAAGVALDVLFSAAMDPAHPQHDQAIWNRQRWLESMGR